MLNKKKVQARKKMVLGGIQTRDLMTYSSHAFKSVMLNKHSGFQPYIKVYKDYSFHFNTARLK